METRQMTHFFHLLFPLELFVTFIFAFENRQNSFSCGFPFGSFWSIKYLNFGKKLRFGQPIILFQKVDNLRLLKIHIIFCPPRGAKKRYQLMDYIEQFHFYWNLLPQKLWCVMGIIYHLISSHLISSHIISYIFSSYNPHIFQHNILHKYLTNIHNKYTA